MSDTELGQRILARVRASTPPTRREVVLRGRILFTLGTAAAVAIFLLFGGFRDGGAPRPAPLVASTFAAATLIAATVVGGAWAKTRSSVGAPASLLWASVVGGPIALIACKIALTAGYPGASAWLTDRAGLRCLGLSLLIGAAWLSAFLAARRGTDAVHPAASGAALGVAAGLASASLMDLWCPVASTPHLLLGHLLPVVVLGIAGSGVGRRILAID